MKFNANSNGEQSPNNQEPKSRGLFQNIVDAIGNAIGNAIKDQYFYNTRNRILDYITQRTNIRTAHVELFVRKIGLSYECRYDLYFPNQEGVMMINKGFFVANISSEDYIPQYILDEVKQNGSVEIDFSTEDLEVLYNEKNIEVKSEATYNSLVKELTDKAYSKMVMIDRVFYTRVQCYDATGKMTGIAHIASITNLPVNVKSSLYPCGSCEVTL